MKRGLTHILAVAIAALIFQACGNITADEGSQEKEAIKSRVEAYTKAFNQGDADKMALLWSQDAYYVNLTTQESIQGKKDITDYFSRLFTQAGAEKLTIALSSIYFPAADEAIVKGLGEITFKDQHTEKSAFILQYIHENGAWSIRSFSLHEMNSSLSHFEELKDLNWLAGNWEDEDDNIDVKYDVEWDANKNFLTQYFVLNILGQEELSGKQIIGWDPVKKNIHSWIFDSDGGYGESVWSKDGNTWYASVTFTLPKGGRASALHVYKKIDDNTYIFASQNRDVDGKLLPNIGPFKVIRK